ncbi:uncharacterized protein RHOBADRAFT_53503 [Rhodotorula graminis WP1]|uniref:Zn(2)-C6 fungal-type domain-containing protein n=1 Tax=Rhodotorula graminis (strain WP1) TaxID=578459 RepID=A0A194S802_RHOGW|nr:uncharacterized protein RHOBADRAFT_53503 [Rhodotorula graminis WP1]KPV75536.1 hypothetical protein RHOBADRAFT_53503 [Rhodotorula graminis WP1]
MDQGSWPYGHPAPAQPYSSRDDSTARFDDSTTALYTTAQQPQQHAHGALQHQSYASTSHQTLDTARDDHSAAFDHRDDDLARLSNARMSKKPKPRQPAPDGVVVTDKSCVRCRVRKVRCNRVFPQCDHCTARSEDCDLKDWKPKPKIKPTDPARVAALEKRLAELEQQVAQGGAAVDQPFPPDAFDFPPDIASFRPAHAQSTVALDTATTRTTRSIGPHSLDWRLAEPHMASSLSRHLCDAFSDSCCFLLPTWEFFRARMSDFLPGNEDRLSAAQRVALTTFCAIGARSSPHSAVLGISLKPEDTLEHPNAPLLSAGTRRQNACRALFDKAHADNYESGTIETPTAENLATLLALLQLSLFAEFHPIKSRPLLRSALSHYRDLQDEAETEQERASVRSTFGFAIYTVDCLISAHARRRPQISDDDLRDYFAHDTRILKTAKHLFACWVCACQRLFAQIVAPTMAPRRTAEERVRAIAQLWTAIDSTHSAAEYLLSLSPPRPGPAQLASLAPGPIDHHDLHEHDYGAQLIRLDRDLLDLVNLVHAHLSDKAAADLPATCVEESTRRVRRALKRRAGYLKAYVDGADAHMTFHELLQLELLPDWTKLVLQRIGESGGPSSVDEEVDETELSWFVEGLQHACYFHPHAETRLLELAPHMAAVEGRLDLSPYAQPAPSPLPAAFVNTSLPTTSSAAVASLFSPSTLAAAWTDVDGLSLPLPPPPTSNPLFFPDPSPPTAPLGLSSSFDVDVSTYGPGDGGAGATAPLGPPGNDEFDSLAASLGFGGALDFLGGSTSASQGWTGGAV